LQNQKQKKVII